MYVIIVYDTESRECPKVHKSLKKYLNWNQRSVFEGNITVAQYSKIESSLEKFGTPNSHIVIYSIENEKFLNRKEFGEGKGNTGNII